VDVFIFGKRVSILKHPRKRFPESHPYIHILDFRDMNAALLQWNEIVMLEDESMLGGILLRGGSPEYWIGVRTWFDKRGSHPLIFADFEQGAASQLTGFSWLPSAFALGSCNDTDITFRVGSLVGRQAKLLGLDGVFAPVADLLLNVNCTVMGSRCYGATPNRVASLCSAFIRGCRSQGIMTVVKHFPGHGRSMEDSHVRTAIVTSTYEEWEQSDLIPFRESIAAGCDGVMAGHIWYSGLDPEEYRPASLSPAVLRHMLRGVLGFRRLIFTDSLDMDAVSPGDREIADSALEAGADYVVGVRNVLSDEAENKNPEPIPLVSVNGMAEGIELLNRETDEVSRTVARESLSWINGLIRRPALCDKIIQFVCIDGASDTWADPFVSRVSERIPCSDILKGSLCDLPRVSEGTLLVTIGRQVNPPDMKRAARVIRSIPAETMICINFGGLRLIPLLRDHATLLGGDALTATQLAAAYVITENGGTYGDPDLEPVQ